MAIHALNNSNMGFGDFLSAFAGGAAIGALGGFGVSFAGLNYTAAFQYVASTAMSGVANMMPQVNIPIGDNFSLGFGPSYGYGTTGFGLGGNVSATYTEGDFQFSLRGNLRGLSNGGYESRLGGGITYHDQVYDQYFSGAITAFGGKDPQKVWQVGWRQGDWSATVSNDYKLGGDKYRTAAIEIGYRDFSLGANIYTTNHIPETYLNNPLCRH